MFRFAATVASSSNLKKCRPELGFTCFLVENLGLFPPRSCSEDDDVWKNNHLHSCSGSRNNSSSSSPSLSIWRRKKEMGKEGLLVVHELKRLQSDLSRLNNFINTRVSRLLRTDLLAVLAEFQRQDQVFLCMKIYELVRKEIWYRPDMFFFRDMLMTLARNRKVDEAMRVWEDMKRENVEFDQHTYGDIIRCFLDNRLPSQAMGIYEEMRGSADTPISLPFRVILKGLIPYPELREKVKQDFQELFPGFQTCLKVLIFFLRLFLREGSWFSLSLVVTLFLLKILEKGPVKLLWVASFASGNTPPPSYKDVMKDVLMEKERSKEREESEEN